MRIIGKRCCLVEVASFSGALESQPFVLVIRSSLGLTDSSRAGSLSRIPVCGQKVDVPETTKPSYFYEGFVLYGAGTRRTVAVSGARFSAGLEFGGKFGVPQLVTINKSAGYGFWWNRIRIFLAFFTT